MGMELGMDYAILDWAPELGVFLANFAVSGCLAHGKQQLKF